MVYFVAGFAKYTEVDNYEEGCLPDTGTMSEVDTRFWSETQKKLIDEIAEWFNVDNGCISLNACEEVGRIDVCRTETADGDKATEYQLDQWKQGKMVLYYVNYTGYLDRKAPRPKWRKIKGCEINS